MTKEEIKEVLAGFTNEEGVTDLDAASEEINKLIVAEEEENFRGNSRRANVTSDAVRLERWKIK